MTPFVITFAKHRRKIFWSLFCIFHIPLFLVVLAMLRFPVCNLSADVSDHNIDFLKIETAHLFNNTLFIIDGKGILHIIKRNN